MEWIETYHLTGLVIGMATFLIIGIFHPIVIKAEYHWGTGCWWIFLVLGIASVTGSILLQSTFLSSLAGVLAFTSFWTIKELFEQKKRVQKGWFPENPKKKKK